jgi:hypothetical protein
LPAGAQLLNMMIEVIIAKLVKNKVLRLMALILTYKMGDARPSERPRIICLISPAAHSQEAINCRVNLPDSTRLIHPVYNFSGHKYPKGHDIAVFDLSKKAQYYAKCICDREGVRKFGF